MTPKRLPTSLATRVKRFVFDTSGSALVEFALTVPLMLLLMFGMVIWGYYLTVMDSMYDAARHAVRELSVSALNETNAEQMAYDYLASWPTTFTVDATDTANAGNEVVVTITASNPLSGLHGLVAVPEDFSVRAVMRKEPTNASSP